MARVIASRAPYHAGVLRTHALEQLHLVVQDVPVGQDKSFLLIRHIGLVEQFPAKLVQSLSPFLALQATQQAQQLSQVSPPLDSGMMRSRVSPLLAPYVQLTHALNS